MTVELKVRYPGSLIVLDGGDCSGKGKQVEMVSRRFRTLLGTDRVITTEEPWRNERSPNGLWIDRLLNADNLGIPKEINPGDGGLLAEQFQTLYLCDRYTHWVKVILPAMLASKLVISDRERMSTFAYGHAFGLDLAEIAQWHALLPPPDMTVWIDVPAEEAIRRKQGRQGLTEHFEDPASMRRIANAYREVFDSGLLPNIVRIDGVGTPEEVHARVWDAVLNFNEALPEGGWML